MTGAPDLAQATPRAGRRRARARLVACVLGAAAVALETSGCNFGPLAEFPITITPPWPPSQLPAWTQGSPPLPGAAVFRLLGQKIAPDGPLSCGTGTVSWLFVDMTTGQRVNVPDARPKDQPALLDDGSRPGLCMTSSVAADAPQAALPTAFDDGRAHTIDVYAEVKASWPAGANVPDVVDGYTPEVVADGRVTVRVAATAAGGGSPQPPPVAAPPATLRVAPISFAAPVQYPTMQHPVTVAADDFHLNPSGSADRRADVAVGEIADHPNTDANSIEVWRTARDGSLNPYAGPYRLPAGAFPDQIVGVDLHGDQRPGLAVADSGTSTARVLRNNGNGTFDVPGTSYTVDQGPDAVATGKLCSLGAGDVATASLYENTITVLCNAGDGTLQTGQVFPAAGTSPGVVASALALAAADLNGDHAADVVVATSGTPGGISVLRNLAAVRGVSFAPAQGIPAYTGSNPSGLAVGDLTGDGLPDIVAANPQDGTISVLINTTTPGATSFSFAEYTYRVPGSWPEAVALGDFNRDGDADIATANYMSGDVSVLQGNGDGTFEPSVNVAAGVGPVALAAADLDGDGNDDLVIAGSGPATGHGSLTVALSTSHLPPPDARDRGQRRHRLTLRRLRATVTLRISHPSRPRFSQDGLMTTFESLTGTGRINARLLGGHRARIGLAAGTLDLLGVDATGTLEADRYFFPPFSDPVILRGTMLWRSRHDRRLLACVRLGGSTPGRVWVTDLQRMTLIGGTGAAARLRFTLEFPALVLAKRSNKTLVTAAIGTGPFRGLPNTCRALVPKLPRN